jgi:long-subunit fatty acid transport protein
LLKFFFRLLTVFVLIPGASFSTSAFGAPSVEIASSPNPVGSGARALGMGGAFISIADDATAASWNPGGLIQLEKPEISFVLGNTTRTEEISFETNPESSGRHTTRESDLNYLSVAYPFAVNYRNMIVSLNYQKQYDFARDWNFEMNINPILKLDMDYEQKGSLYALGLAYAVEVTPEFSVGATLNYWGDFIHANEWKQTYNETLTAFGLSVQNNYAEKFDFDGWNANLGFLWDISEHWTLGGVLKTPFKAEVDHSREDNGTVSNSNDSMDMPMSYGLGVAYRFSDEFTISGDIYRTHWEDFIYRSEDGVETSPISGKKSGESDIDTTTWFRAGGEYLFILNKITVAARAGVFFDQAPAEGAPDDYYGFSLGSGVAYKSVIWDIAYQYRYGNEVGQSLLPFRGFSQDVEEQIVYTSLIMHF